jgi:hypothetical protein
VNKRVSVFRGVLLLLNRYSLFLTSLVICVFFVIASAHTPFWDFQVYTKAADRFDNNLDPYALLGKLNYVYPPLTTYIIGALASVNALIPFFVALYCGSVMYFLIESKKFLYLSIREFKMERIGFFLTIIFGTCCLGYMGIFSGNIGMYLHFLIHAGILHLYRRQELVLLQVSLSLSLIVASLFKPYFLLYLISLLLIFRARILVLSVVTLMTTTLLYLYSFLAMRDQFDLFIRNLKNATVSSGDLGFGFTIWLSKNHLSILAIAIHAVVIMALSYIIVKKWKISLAPVLVIPSLLLAALANPRMKEYDMAVIVSWLVLLIARGYESHASRITLRTIVFSNLAVTMFMVLTIDTFLSSFYFILQMLSSLLVTILVLYLNHNNVFEISKTNDNA